MDASERVLSLLLQLNQETMDLKVVRLVPDAGWAFIEAKVPTTLSDDDVVILDESAATKWESNHLPERIGSSVPTGPRRTSGTRRMPPS